MTDLEIIQLLGGPTAIARLLGIKPPSVHEWLTTGIPEGRLRELAGHLEIVSGGRFLRRERWPDKYTFYWPELATALANTVQPAIEVIAPPVSPIHDADTGMRSGGQRRQGGRYEKLPVTRGV